MSQSNVQTTRRTRSAVTVHARRRQQQRVIPQIIVDLLQEHAEPVPAGGGDELLRFSKRSWRHATADLGPQAKHFERYQNAYLVQAQDGTVITVAWQH